MNDMRYFSFNMFVSDKILIKLNTLQQLNVIISDS